MFASGVASLTPDILYYTLPSLTSISFPTFPLLFLFCFPMSHPTFQSLFQSNFLHVVSLVPSFKPLQILLVASFCSSATNPYELLSLPWPWARVPCVVLLTQCWSFLADPINWYNAHMALKRHQNRCHRCTWTILSMLALTQSQQHSPRRTRAGGTCSWWQPGLLSVEAAVSSAAAPKLRGSHEDQEEPVISGAVFWPRNVKTAFAVSQLSCTGSSEPLIIPCS